MLPVQRTVRSQLRHVRAPLLPLRPRHAFTTLGPRQPFTTTLPPRQLLSQHPTLHLRFASTSATDKIQIKPRSRWLHYLQRALAYFGLSVLVTSGLIVAFFVYDATTYREDPESYDIPVSEYALTPRRGGPKNLPIAEYFVSDDEPEFRDQKHKPKLVILGTGWASVALLKQLQAGGYPLLHR